MALNKLTSEEKRVIEDKGTEAPFSGEYNENFRDGVYLCRRCNALLYDANDKFHSGCGWPSFDDEIKGAVKRQPDADGSRTELNCSNCGAHLGHVFTGEKFTAKDVRHCVNSLSMRFIPRDFPAGEKPTAVLGGGCFWCLDAAFRTVPGVSSVISGYAGGEKANPTYEEVGRGDTGQAETVKITYDPFVVKYEDLLTLFFKLHDPTTSNRQGNDVGEQYRSIILYQTWREKEIAERLIEKLTAEKIFKQPIVTEIKPLAVFYPAEEYHQDYFAKNPANAYCQAVIRPKLEKLK